MDDETNVGGRDRLVRFGLAALLSVVAVRWLRAGKRLRGLLAGAGALGVGFTATTGYCGVNDALDVDTTADGDEVSVDFDDDPVVAESDTTESDASASSSLTCAACGEPIVPGQSRGPNSEGDIVHDDCQ